MSRWFRVYDDAINDPKVLRLPEATRWHWIAVLAIASKNDGALPSIEDIALMLRKSRQAATAILATLKDAGLVDETEAGLAPHNWNGRQFKSDVSTERVQRFRNAKRNVSSTVSETPPETDTESEQILGADAPTPIRKSKKASTAFPEGFALDDAMRKYAGDRGFAGVNVERMFERFSNHHRAKGSKFADWHAAWRTWVGNQVEFDAQRNAPQQRKIPDV